jgi:hypothetical protein
MGLVRVPALEVLFDQPAEPSEQSMLQFGDRALIPALASSSWSYRLAVGRRGDCRPPHPLEDASERRANAGVEALSHLPRSYQEGVQKGRTDGNSMKSGFVTDSCTDPKIGLFGN